MKTQKNNHATSLGKLSWEKRKDDPDIKEKLSKAGKKGGKAKHKKWKLTKAQEVAFSNNVK
jgi:hypothetical protein